MIMPMPPIRPISDAISIGKTLNNLVKLHAAAKVSTVWLAILIPKRVRAGDFLSLGNNIRLC